MTKPFNISAFLCTILLAAAGCHAQTPATPFAGLLSSSTPLSPEQARRVEVLVRQKANLPPGSTVTVGARTHGEMPGYDTVAVVITNEGQSSHPINFLLSTDGKTLAQFTKYDIAADPRNLVSAADRPSRGGPLTAPVLIVNFDDLECPYCARLHSTIFPALTDRYGDKVHIVYRDFPLDQHPWAMHAAVDVNCLAAQSVTGYWNLIDGIHARASDITTAAQNSPDKDKALKIAFDALDKLTLEQGKLQQIDLSKLNVCLQQQDTKDIQESVKLGTSLGVESTPSLFINGAKIDGAVPLDFIFAAIDEALRAENVTPPALPPAPPTQATPQPSK